MYASKKDQEQTHQTIRTESNLAQSGFQYFEKKDYVSYASMNSLELVEGFKKDWTSLEVDKFMNDGGNYRTRRFGQFHYQPELDALVPYRGRPMAFFQSADVNKLNGGIPRVFDPIPQETMDHPILRDLIRFHFNALNVQDKSKPWKVFVHQIRITARDNMKGLPTPEGIHQDGHAYVAQILIDRKNVKGATSTIYDQNRSNLFRHTLTQPFDTILVNDKQVWHGVTPVRQLDSSFPGTRDMLLLDFNPA